MDINILAFELELGKGITVPEIFDYIEEGDELVEKPFQRLVEQQLLHVNRYNGFWQQMDTFREKIIYDRMEAQGNCPWMLHRK